MKTKKQFLTKTVKYLTILVAVVAMIAGAVLNNVSPVFAGAKVADLPTHDKYTESLGEDVSTEYAGRVWTDKTVYEQTVTINDNGDSHVFKIDENNPNNFLVSFSALATGQQVTGQTNAPLDVVFVIDFSNSMNDDMSTSDKTNRIDNAIKALNDSIDYLMNLNDHTRVAVVSFSNEAQTLLELGRYSKGRPNIWSSENYFSVSDSTVRKHVYPEGGRAQSSANYSVSGGTNIQMGLYHGMNILAQNTDKEVIIDGNTVKRIPSVILLSDGAPTYSSNSENWWAPGNNDYDGPGNTNTVIPGNAMKALMTATYMKAAIDRNYFGESQGNTAYKTTVYSVGVGITGLSKESERNLAYATIDPGKYFDYDKTTGNDIVKKLEEAWDTYRKGETPSLAVGSRNAYGSTEHSSTYTWGHPEQHDINDLNLNYVDTYYSADDANSLSSAFNEIVTSISLAAPEVPTEYDVTNPMGTGYITYTDPIGEYMEIKNIKAIIYDGKRYDVTKNQDGIYSVPTDTITTSIHGDHNLNEVIELNITESKGQQVLEVKIPGGLIPIRINTITLAEKDGETIVENNISNKKSPIRVIYEVGLKDDVIDENGVVNPEVVSPEYINKNLTADGSVNFYTNLYKGNTAVVNGEEVTVGEATVHFEPSHSNSFYYITDNTPVYIYNNNGTKGALVKTVATITNGNPNAQYCYEETYYYNREIRTELVVRSGAQLANTELAEYTDSEGNKFVGREIGSYRPNRIGKFEGTKISNATKTAGDFYAPTFQGYAGNPYEGEFVIYLGNNGVVSFPSSGTLKISKSVTAASGLEAPDATFEFKVNLKDNAGKALTDSFPVGIYNANGELIDNTVRTVSNGGSVYLKAGQYAQIMYLPHGATYTVEEVNLPGGFSQTSMTDSGDGKIVAGALETVEFVNNYSVTPAIVQNAIRVDKTLTGRPWNDSDKFTFKITTDSEFLPENTTVEVTTGTAERLRYFGPITFTKPGVYTYYITENIDSTTNGITYSRAIYEVVITVTDNKNGTMSSDVVMTQMTTDSNESINKVITDNIARFTNKYDADIQDWSPRISKNYTDHVGSNPLKDGMFTFIVTPEPGSPMPGSATTYETTNIGSLLTFARRTFDSDDIGKTYTYKIEEKIPEGAVDNVYEGMTYDDKAIYVSVTTSHDGPELVITTEYYTMNNGEKVVLDNPAFDNEYNAAPVKVDINGTKVLSGRDWLNSDSFTFTIEAADETSAGSVTLTNKEAEDGVEVPFVFEDIEFNKLGVYTFNIKETSGNAKGITYDKNVCTVVVTVTDTDTDGQLEANVTYSNSGNQTTINASFTNVYKAAPTVLASLNGTKELKTDVETKFLAYGDFQFEIKPLKNAPMGESKNINLNGPANTAEPRVAGIELLKNIEFTEAGEYQYEIKEVIPSNAVYNKYLGVTYDDTVYIVTIVVKDDYLNGELYIDNTTIKADDEDVTSQEIKFVNEYKVEDEVIALMPLDKIIRGRNFKEGDEFTFVLSLTVGDDENVVIEKNKVTINPTSGNKATIDFGTITFKAVGEYTFQIEEVGAGQTKDGLTYSNNIATRKFIVEDDGLGGLTVTRGTVTGDLEFVNIYNATPAELGFDVSKTYKKLETPNSEEFISAWNAQDTFTFKIEGYGATTSLIGTDVILGNDSTNKLLSLEISNTDLDNMTVADKVFDDKITFNKAGDYQFVVYEEASANSQIPGVVYDTVGRIVNVKVTDNLNGVLTATIDSITDNRGGEYEDKDIHFTNIYDPGEVVLSGHEELIVSKQLIGRKWVDDDQFTFTIKLHDNTDFEIMGYVKMPLSTVTVTKDNVDHIHFGSIEFSHEGTFYFEVKEVVPDEAGDNEFKGITYDSNPIYVKVVTEFKQDTDSLEIASVEYSRSLEFNDKIGGLMFINNYSVTSTQATIPVFKEITGRDWKDDDEFEFTIVPSETYNGVTIPNETLTINKNTENHAGQFVIDFTKVGEYRFTINEAPNTENNGLVNDTTPRNIIISVNDNFDGTLSAFIVNNDFEEIKTGLLKDYMTFNNVYSAEEATANLSLTKKLLHHTITNREFAFQAKLKSGDATGIVYPTGYVYNQGENVDFGEIKFTKVGEYTLQINEIKPTEAVDNFYNGITYDDRIIEIKYIVTDDANGQLQVVETSDSTNKEFVNVYQSTGSFDIPVTKEFTGRTNANGAENVWERTDEFTFNLTLDKAKIDGEDLTAEQVMSNGYVEMPNSSIKITAFTRDFTDSFEDIVVHKAGKYYFKVSEVNNEVKGIKYDDTVFDVVVEANDDGEGEITFEFEDENNIVFKNEYKPDPVTLLGSERLPVIKNFTGRPNNVWLDEDKFTFTIKEYDETTINAVAAGDVVMNTPTTIVVDKDNKDSAHFNDIVFKKAGTYKFEVKEIISEEDRKDYITYDTDSRIVTVVVGNRSSQLTVDSVTFDVKGTDVGTLTFNNVYDTKSVVLDGETYLEIEKVLNGRNWNSDDEFNFILWQVDEAGTAINDPNVVIAEGGDTTTITKEDYNDVTKKYTDSFGDITFKEPGSYIFKVEELLGSAKNLTYDSHVLYVYVNVADNNEGHLVTSVDYYSVSYANPRVFTNTYTPDPITVSLTGTKTMSGRDLKDTDKFTFTLEAIDNAPLPENVTTINGINGNDIAHIQFDAITYKAAGTYEYKIKETGGKYNGVTNDSGYVIATVVVDYNADTGEFSSSVTYKDEDGNEFTGNSFEFVNSYDANDVTIAEIKGNKVVNTVGTGDYTIEDNKFSFRITPDSNNPTGDPIEETVVQNTGSTFTFGTYTYSTPGKFVYYIQEEVGNIPGMSYDTTIHTIVVDVTDDTDGNLHANVTGNTEITITNNYNPTDISVEFTGIKELVGKDLVENQFIFILKGKNVEQTVQNKADGTFAFNPIEFTNVGTYTYEVTEIANSSVGNISNYTFDDTIYTVTVEIENDQTAGALYVDSITYSDGTKNVNGIKFNNIYTPHPTKINGEISVNKTLSGRELVDGEFKFELLDGTKVVATGTNENGIVKFTSVEGHSITKVGEYSYTIREVNTPALGGVEYDDNTHTVSFEVVDNEGQLKICNVKYDGSTNRVTFSNIYTPNPTTVQFGAGKWLEGRPLNDNEFTFEKVYKSGKDTEGNDVEYGEAYTFGETEVNGGVATATNDINGVVLFSPDTITKAGEFVIEVREQKGSLGGVRYSEHVVTYTVHVTDDLQGHLSATYNVTDNHFVNTYEAKDALLTITAKKELTNKTLEDGEFTFILKNDKGEKVAETTNKADGTIEFKDVVFEEEGTFAYTITEVSGNQAGIAYDGNSYPVIINVTDDMEGQLHATLAPTSQAVTFKNTYNEPILTIEKVQVINGVEHDVTHGIVEVEPGELVSYVIRIKSLEGRATAKDVVITDEIPEGLKLVSIDDNGKEKAGVVTWDIGELPAGKTVEVSFTVKVPEVKVNTEWENIAAVIYNEGKDPEDPDKTVESEKVEINVELVPELTSVKTQSINGGNPTTKAQQMSNNVANKIKYTITVTAKEGTNTAKNIVVTDEIPAGTTLVKDSITNGGVEKDGIITWTIEELEPGKSITVEFEVEVAKDVDVKEINNQAEITWEDEPDEDGDKPEDFDKPTNKVEIEVDDMIKDTGDDAPVALYAGILGISAIGLGALFVSKKKKRD